MVVGQKDVEGEREYSLAVSTGFDYNGWPFDLKGVVHDGDGVPNVILSYYIHPPTWSNHPAGPAQLSSYSESTGLVL